MSRADRKYAARLSNYYGTRRDESGNGECFAPTYRQTLGMSPLAQTTSALVAPAQTDDPLLRSIAMTEDAIARIKAGTLRDDLTFYERLLTTKQAELAARG